MNNSQIICPQCHSRLNKPPQLEVLGDIKKGGGSFMAFGNPDDMLTCPACGFKLKIQDIIDGKYDEGLKGNWLSVIFAFAFLAFIIWLIIKCSSS